MGENPQVTFTDSCVPVQIVNCQPGTDLINPCNCQKYFECDNFLTVINRTCAAGSFYDHTSGICDRKEEVVLHGICDPLKPWEQCLNTTGANIADIASKCGGTHVTTSTTPTTTTMAPADSSGNAGVIAGVVIACVLLALILGILVFWWYRKRQKTQKEKGTRGSIQNPGYFTKQERTDSVYAHIDDNMNNPVYNTQTLSSTRPPLPSRPSSEMSNTSSVVGLQPNGVTKEKDPRALMLEAEYVEPTLERNAPKISSRTSETLESGNSDYAEIVPENKEHTEPKEEPSPYDNSWQA